MKTMLMIAASAASAGLLFPTLAEARTSESFEQVSKIVRYDDLDLTSLSGQRRLDRRIAISIRQICGDPRQIDLVLSAAAKACTENAKGEASREVRLAIAQAQSRKRAA